MKTLFILIILLSSVANAQMTEGVIHFEQITPMFPEKTINSTLWFTPTKSKFVKKSGERHETQLMDHEASLTVTYGNWWGWNTSLTSQIAYKEEGREQLTREEAEAEWSGEMTDEEWAEFNPEAEYERPDVKCSMPDTSKVIAGYNCKLLRIENGTDLGDGNVMFNGNYTDYWFTSEIVSVYSDELLNEGFGPDCQIKGKCLEISMYMYHESFSSMKATKVENIKLENIEELFDMTVPEGYPDIQEGAEEMAEEMWEGMEEAIEGAIEEIEAFEDNVQYSEKLDTDMGYDKFKIRALYKDYEKYFDEEYVTYDEETKIHSINLSKASVTKFYDLNIKRLVLGFYPITGDGLEVDRISFFCEANEVTFDMLVEIYGEPTFAEIDEDDRVYEATWYSSEGITLEYYNGRDFDPESGYMSSHHGNYEVIRIRLNY